MFPGVLIDFNNLFNFTLTQYFVSSADLGFVNNTDRFFFNFQPTKKEFNSEWFLIHKRIVSYPNYFGFEKVGFSLISKLTKHNYLFFLLTYLPFFILIFWLVVFLLLGFISLERTRIIFLISLSLLVLFLIFFSFYFHNVLPVLDGFRFVGFGNKIYKLDNTIKNQTNINLITPVNKFSKFNALNYLYSSEMPIKKLCRIDNLKVCESGNTLSLVLDSVKFTACDSYDKFQHLKINKKLHPRFYTYDMHKFNGSPLCRDKYGVTQVFEYSLHKNSIFNFKAVDTNFFREHLKTRNVKYSAMLRFWLANLSNYSIHSEKNMLTTLSSCFWPPIVSILSFIGLTYKTNKKRLSVFSTLKNNIKQKNKSTYYRRFIIKEIYKIHGGIGLIEYTDLEKLPKIKKIKHSTGFKVFNLNTVILQFKTAMYTRVPTTTVWVCLVFWMSLVPTNKPVTAIIGWFILLIYFLKKNSFKFLLTNYKKLYLYSIYRNTVNYYIIYNKTLKLDKTSRNNGIVTFALNYIHSIRVFFLIPLEGKFYYLFTILYSTLSLFIFNVNWAYPVILDFTNVLYFICLVVFTLLIVFSTLRFSLKNSDYFKEFYLVVNKTAVVVSTLILLGFLGFIASKTTLDFCILDTKIIKHTGVVIIFLIYLLLQLEWVLTTKILFLEKTNKFINLFFLKTLYSLIRLLIFLIMYLFFFSFFFSKISLFIFFFTYFTVHCSNVILVYVFSKQNKDADLIIFDIATTLSTVVLLTLPTFVLIVNLQQFKWQTHNVHIVGSFLIAALVAFFVFILCFSWNQRKEYEPVYLFLVFIGASYYLLINFDDFLLTTPGSFYTYDIHIQGSSCLIIWSWSILRFWRVIKYTKQPEIVLSLVLLLIPTAFNLIYNWRNYFILLDHDLYFFFIFLYELICICLYLFNIKKVKTVQSVRVITFLLTISIYVLILFLFFNNGFKYCLSYIICIILNCIQFVIVYLCILPTTNSTRSGLISDLKGSLNGFRFIKKLFGCFIIVLAILILITVFNVT